MFFFWLPASGGSSIDFEDSYDPLAYDVDAYDADAWAGLDSEPPVLRLVIAGDSIGAPVPLCGVELWSGMTFPDDYMPYEVKNHAFGGASLTSFPTTLNAALIADYTTAYGPNGCWLFIQAGINDLASGGKTARQLYAAATSLTVQAHLAGIRVMIGTILPIDIFVSMPAEEAERVAYNGFVRGNGAAADAIADVAADAVMGLQATTFNPLYYIDGTHPTVLGETRLRPIWEGAEFFDAIERVVAAGAVRDISPTVSVRLLTPPPPRSRAQRMLTP